MEERHFQPPTAKQTRIIWLAVTALSFLLFVASVGALLWAAGWALQRLTPVLLPLAIAGIVACLLDPLVDFFERKGIPRTRSILLVFLLGLGLIGGAMATVVPRLVVETNDLAKRFPGFANSIADTLEKWSEEDKKTPESERTISQRILSHARVAWSTKDVRDTVQGWVGTAAPVVSGWFVSQFSRIASWLGLIVGIAMVPVYLFYLLLEKRGITKSWTNYLPLQESRWKQEAIFIIQAINDYLILFFRGQVLVALCDGILLTLGFFAIGLDYALLLGFAAGLLSIVPFLGVVISIVPAILLAVVQFGDWLHPALVLGLFALVQFLEGFVISPKIMGDRVGLHPLTIILAVMIGTTLMGGIIGGILAIPLTAALRVLMFRYVWVTRHPPVAA